MLDMAPMQRRKASSWPIACRNFTINSAALLLKAPPGSPIARISREARPAPALPVDLFGFVAP
jgi:hypothetical protein